MTDDMEIELKLSIRAGAIATLLATEWLRATIPATTPLTATYFDTPDHHLRKGGYALRIRAEDGRTVQTIKASGEAAGLFARPEWECDLDGEAPRLDPAAGPLGELLSPTTRAAIAPAFVTAVQRTTARVTRDGATIELAVDHGAVSAGDRRDTICEVELELKSGTPAALFALARTIDALTPVRIGVLSKSDRGYRLMNGAAGGAEKATRVALDPAMPAREAFRAIARSCLRQFRLNEDRLAGEDDPATLHQARVGLRRLRSAFSLFGPLLAEDPRAEWLRGELKWLQATLGEARDLDVLIARIGGDDAAARLALARTEAYEVAEQALKSDRARAMMLDLVEWLATGPWLAHPDGERTIALTAAAILDSHRRKLKKRGRDLATLDDAPRHRVRIEAKKLRYATEFFAALYVEGKPARRHARFLAAMERLQDKLGALNDIATAPALIASLGLPEDALPKAKRKPLLRAAEDAFDDLVDARPFWR